MTAPKVRNPTLFSPGEMPPECPVILSFGGGVDSTALLLRWIREGLRLDAVLFADTGEEDPVTLAFIKDHVEPLLRKAAIRFEVVKSGRGRLVDYFTHVKAIPSMSTRDCTVNWKILPIRRWAKANLALGAQRKCMVLIGVDYGEIQRVSISDHKWYVNVYPLVGWKMNRDMCKEEIRTAGLPVPPKSGCQMCIYAKKKWFLKLAQDDPEYFARARRMEDAEIEDRLRRGEPPLLLTTRPMSEIEWEAKHLLKGTKQTTIDATEEEDIRGDCGGYCRT